MLSSRILYQPETLRIPACRRKICLTQSHRNIKRRVKIVSSVKRTSGAGLVIVFGGLMVVVLRGFTWASRCGVGGLPRCDLDRVVQRLSAIQGGIRREAGGRGRKGSIYSEKGIGDNGKRSDEVK